MVYVTRNMVEIFSVKPLDRFLRADVVSSRIEPLRSEKPKNAVVDDFSVA